MYTLYIYNGHWENDVFMRDSLRNVIDFRSIREIRDYLSNEESDFYNYDYLIESPNGSFNSIYRFNF